jgi:hypothetical protein
VNDKDTSLVAETVNEGDRVGECEYDLVALTSYVGEGVNVSDGLPLSLSDLSGV